MTKAEERALRAYPKGTGEDTEFDTQFMKDFVLLYKIKRRTYQEGYEQAEKDLILTWRDIKTIVEIADKLVEKDVIGQLPEVCETEVGYYNAILEEFNETRK